MAFIPCSRKVSRIDDFGSGSATPVNSSSAHSVSAVDDDGGGEFPGVCLPMFVVENRINPFGPALCLHRGNTQIETAGNSNNE